MTKFSRSLMIMARVKKTQPIKMITTNDLRNVMRYEVTD